MKYPGLYLCLFTDGTLKIGRANNIEKRIRQHKHDGLKFAISIEKSAAVPCVNNMVAERRLIQWGDKNCTSKNCNEWFIGLNFEECLRSAEEICKISDEEHALFLSIPRAIYDPDLEIEPIKIKCVREKRPVGRPKGVPIKIMRIRVSLNTYAGLFDMAKSMGMTIDACATKIALDRLDSEL